jgi:hypothetical protein
MLPHSASARHGPAPDIERLRLRVWKRGVYKSAKCNQQP